MQNGINLDKDDCARCLRAGYYKFGCANFMEHTHDGFCATGVIEYDLIDVPDDYDSKEHRQVQDEKETEESSECTLF